MTREVILQGILESWTDYVIAFAPDFRYLHASEAAARLLGTTPAEVIGRPWDAFVSGHDVVLLKRQALDVLETRQSFSAQAHFAGRHFEYTMSPILDARGDVDMIVLIGRDVTQRVVAAERAGSLQRLTARLASAVTPKAIADVVIDEMQELLGASRSLVYFLLPDGLSLGLAAWRGVPDSIQAHLGVVPLAATLPVALASRLGQPLWCADRAALVAVYPHCLQEKPDAVTLNAAAVLPLSVQSRVVGCISFMFAQPRAFDEATRQFLLTLAGQCAQALERARLHEAEHASRTRLGILADATRRLSEAQLDLTAVIDGVCLELANRLQGACGIGFCDGSDLRLVAHHDIDAQSGHQAREMFLRSPVRIGGSTSLGTVAATGRPILVPVIAMDAMLAATQPEYRDYFRSHPRGSMIAVPLTLARRTIGVLTASRGPGQPPFQLQDQSLLQDIADRTALAVESARMFEGERRAKEQLALLASASQLLASSLDYEQTLEHVAGLAIPALADLVCFDLVQPDGSLRRLARADGDPDRQAMLEQSHRGDLRVWLRELGFQSVISVPLAYHERVLGALTLCYGPSGRQYQTGDLEVADELARRCAAAVEHARLFRAVQQAVGARDDFLSIAGHELKTPLAALQLQIQIVQREVERGALEVRSLKDRLGRAAVQVGRLDRLINELLDVSRITGGRLTLHAEDLDLGALVREVTERFSEQLARAGCACSVEVAPGVLGRWDRARMDQVLSNLLSNALKYGAGAPIEVGLARGDATAILSVRDRGIGIAAADRERIFGRFERAVSERNYGGLGLGLWISRQVVESLGGTIRCDSELGAGSAFVVELPVDRVPPVG